MPRREAVVVRKLGSTRADIIGAQLSGCWFSVSSVATSWLGQTGLGLSECSGPCLRVALLSLTSLCAWAT
jgi:hypothetical protein